MGIDLQHIVLCTHSSWEEWYIHISSLNPFYFPFPHLPSHVLTFPGLLPILSETTLGFIGPLYCFLVSVSLTFTLIVIISFLLLVSHLDFSYFSRTSRCIIWLFGIPLLFLCIHLQLYTTFIVSYGLWYVVLTVI